MLRRRPHPDQLALPWSKDAQMERIIEARVALRAEAEAIRWRFRLVLIETVMMASLVAAGGIALDQPTGQVARAALLVGGACFASGMLLIALSGAAGWTLSWLRRRRAR